MKFAIKTTAALLLTTAAAQAGGIERYNQGLAPLFEDGNYVELGFGHVSPTVSGAYSVGLATGRDTGEIGKSFNQVGLALKYQFNDNLSGMVMLNEPFGADVAYNASSPLDLLGGTQAEVNSLHLTAVLRYKMDNNIGFHGGVNLSRADGNVTLAGGAYQAAGVNGYNVDLASNTAAGFLAGISWEKPEIAARVSLTYHDEITHKFDTTETLTAAMGGAAGLPAGVGLPTGKTEVTTPKSWTLDWQTGVAPGTLVFGSIRWVDWSVFQIRPPVFGAGGTSLTDFNDTTTYTLGMGRQINDQWSLAGWFTFEKRGDELASPLAPTNGRRGISLAAVYRDGPMKITTGINYSTLGDAYAAPGNQPVARMEGNSLWGAGVRVGYSF